jgi:hypothetical protein
VVDVERGVAAAVGPVCGATTLGSLGVSGDAQRVVTVSDDGTVRRCTFGRRIGAAESFRIPARKRASLDPTVFAPPAVDRTGARMTVSLAYGRATVVDLDARTVLDRVDLFSDAESSKIDVNPLGVGALAISADGTTVAVGAVDGDRIVVKDLSRDRVRRVLGHPDGTDALALAPDASLLAIVEPETARSTGYSVLRLRDLATDRAIGDPALFGDFAPDEQHAAFSSAGTTLAVSGRTYPGSEAQTRPAGITRSVEYVIDDEAWAARACALAGRRLDRDEWDRLLPGTPYVDQC